MKIIKPWGVLAGGVLLFAVNTPVLAVSSDAKMQQEILSYVNQYRLQHGLNALTLNPIISAEAIKHSQDMARHAIPFGHQYFSDRVKRLYGKIKEASGAAENVAFNYKDTKYLVSQWVKSPGHRRNIVGHYKLTGIGIARDKQGKIYYTQMFMNTGGRG